MASGDLLKKLFKSYRQKDDETFRAVAMDIVKAEQSKNHHLLARDLQRILAGSNRRSANRNSDMRHSTVYQFEALPRERGASLLEVRVPERYLADMVVSDEVNRQIAVTLQEFQSRRILQTALLSPRHKLLFYGPPGCGKTACAEAMASELGLPLLYTRFDAIISSYLGETAANLRQVFDYVANGSWVLFFDEFDAIGKSRDDRSEHGELKRVINSFLQLLDGLSADTLLIAATNHESLLDKALWRRFDDLVYFPLPTEEQIHLLLPLKLRGVRHKKVELKMFEPQMKGWSYADIERVCLEAIKISVLAGKQEINNQIFGQALERQLYRHALLEKMNNVNS
jgi:SpoVK/Ycf46/Vps4 family AAA+-type ATPase